jgi:hypothetical protein
MEKVHMAFGQASSFNISVHIGILILSKKKHFTEWNQTCWHVHLKSKQKFVLLKLMILLFNIVLRPLAK